LQFTTSRPSLEKRVKKAAEKAAAAEKAVEKAEDHDPSFQIV
jgi:hypothetical protein